ncbi:hypothetical protein RRG08_020882 [Elysia crispata]|uniref:Uncharacterized protein n=1 Tax=Elysia crispata TaxID=231223 RepID=A0AAE0XV93_9GAST|nr:hypothetical protein RRG08_020882 [Elysia crispata]
MFNIKFIEADTVEEEAEIILTETDITIHKGNELVIKGELLLKKADEIEQSLGNSVGKRAIGKRDAKGFQAIISAVREAALRAIKAGRTIVGNSEKISAALNDAVKDIRAVIAEGLIDVGGAISDVGDSVSKAGQVLNQAKTAADNIDLGLGDTATELEITGKLSIEAAQSFEEVGRRSVTLAQRIVRLGKNLVEKQVYLQN